MKNKIDKQALREKIQGLKGLSNEDKSQLLALLAEQKKYGLVWEDSKEDAEEVLRENIPVLREVVEKRLDDGGDDAPNHILIEGDNLHALTALTYTHEGKVDVIYIDPPYNTGNKDFVYNDSFVDSEDSYRHSKWLSFMEKRLKIAKKLLSDKGVIFISIDDNEQANLKLLCDEVFGYNNYIASFVWKKKQGGGNDSKYVVTEHEYLLTYCKDSTIFRIGLDKLYKPSDNLYPYKDEKGDYGTITLDKASIQFSQSLVYEIVGPDGTKYFPRIVNGKQSCWRWGKAKVQKQYDELVFKNGKVYTKYYRPDGVIPRSLLVDVVYGRTESGKDDLAAIFSRTPFDYPKPVSLLKHCVNIGGGKSSLILDFFAGSGTTLHATMQLNAEDGGHRQCILVTNNENNICEEVTYERNKRVINGYTTPKGVLVEGLKANNLRYYQMDLLSHDGSHQSRKEIAYAMTDLLCIKEGIYDEQDAFGNLSLTGKSKMLRYFAEDGKQMLLIYDSRVIPYIVKEIEQMDKTENDIKIYIFADGSYPYTADFDDVLDKVSLIAMPYAMDRALKLVLPEKEDIELEVEPEIVEDNA